MQKIKVNIFNKKIGLTWLGLLLICGLLYVLVLLPQSRRLQTLENQVAEKQRQYEQTLQDGNAHARRRSLLNLVTIQDQLNGYVTGLDAVGNIMLEIGGLANQNQLELFSCKEMTDQPFQEIPNCKLIGKNYLNVSFKAGFTQFAAFLNQLERHRPVIMTDSFRISRSSQDPTDNDISMSLVVLVTQENLRRPLNEMLRSCQLTREVILDQSEETSLANLGVLRQQ